MFSNIKEVSFFLRKFPKNYKIATLISVILLPVFLLHQNFISFTARGYIGAFPNICLIQPGKANCSSTIYWESSVPGACVFLKGSEKIFSCQASGKRNIDWLNNVGYVFELRESNDPKSPLITSITAAGINVSEKDLSVTGISTRLENEKIVNNPGGISSTWDGMIFFSARNIPNRGYAWTVKIIRPEVFDNVEKQNFSFNVPGAFSQEYILDSEYVPAGDELTKVKLSNTFKNILGLERLGLNESKMTDRLHMNVYPNPMYSENPYISDELGVQTTAGKFQTYRFFLISSPSQIVENGVVVSPGTNFLTITDFQVVISNPNTTNSQIQSVKVVTSAKALKDTNQKFLTGYEASVSLDGRMIAWSGYPPGSTNKGYVVYSYIQNSFNTTTQTARTAGWSPQASLADMYYNQGPGRVIDGVKSEILVNGLPFSKRFPIAKFPIKDDVGNIFKPGEVLRGSYIWLSLDASELLFSTLPAITPHQRRGTVLVGARTMGKLRYIDGAINPVRGNPTDNYYLWNDQPSTADIFKEINSAYNNMLLPNANGISAASKISNFQFFWNILFTPIMVTPGSWSAFTKLKNSPLPLNNNTEVIGGLMSGTDRYVEVPITENLQDSILYLPMNESLVFDKELMRLQMLAQANTYSGRMVRLDPTKTPDLSKYDHTGYLRNGAKFPFEYYDVKNRWANSRILLDRSEGAIGNSIFMNSGSYVEVPLKREVINLLQEKQMYSFNFWFRPNSELFKTTLVDWPGLFKINLKTTVDTLNNSMGVVELQHSYYSGNNASTYTYVPPVDSIGNLKFIANWQHLSVNYKQNRVMVYLNGELVASYIVPGRLEVPSTTINNLVLGPQNLTSVGRIDLDEVAVYLAFLNYSEVAKLSSNKIVETELTSTGSTLIKPNYVGNLPFVIPENNPYSRSVAQLGKVLFQSPYLSKKSMVSCASCHISTISFADSVQFSNGDSGLTGRNSPSLLNRAFSRRQFWDASAPSLESQVLHPIINGPEMGMEFAEVISRLNSDAAVKSQFQTVFGAGPSITNISKALASYVRSLTTGPSTDDLNQLSESAIRGKRIFNGKANCIACHSGPLFSDEKTHDIGLSEIPTLYASLGDLGAHVWSGRISETYGMKTPSLRNVKDTKPYFHDGRKGTLMSVVNFYNLGGDDAAALRPSRSNLIRPLNLSEQDKVDLVNYLNSLSGSVIDSTN